MHIPFNIESPDDLVVYSYEHMDDLSFVRSAESVTNDHILFSYDTNSDRREAVEEIVRQKFTTEGWEGDGELGLIWLPPFVLDNPDTYGTYVWHVKQRNNGTSWIASSERLNFRELEQQNREWPQGTPIHILEDECDRALDSVAKVARRTIALLAQIENDDPARGEDKISAIIIEHAYCELVQEFQHFLDDCYLVLLQESLTNGNFFKIKLRLPKAKFSFDISDLDDAHYMDADMENWFIRNHVISAIWKAFKFEGAKDRVVAIPKSVGLKWDDGIVEYLKVSIAIRNCFQHHSGQLVPDVLNQLGLPDDKLKLRDEVGTYELKVWKMIKLNKREFSCLCYHLRHAIKKLSSHVNANIAKRYYRTERGTTIPRL
ncbi:hypothetical protein [Pseudodesulfovibrio sp.]|uniref:hypothetical protein n=1 Tax=unclassified Pseudodesulfovibrio TaxID=2661612 RepID=UPI003AFF96CA